MYKALYSHYIYSINQEGSNKAASYIKAIDWLCKMLEIEPYSFHDCINLWSVESSKRIHELYEFVLIEGRKGNASRWNIVDIPPSYLQKGYCSAALRSYEAFLVEKNYEKDIIDVFNSYEGNESELPNRLDLTLKYPKYLLEGINDKEGKDIIRTIRVRSNQNVFRKMILSIYNQSCCITGLNIPEINRASHIVPWAVDETIRLDPTNGLCLSATYDAAFDRYLISLDDDYRIILSRRINEFATNKAVKDQFLNVEGSKILLPSKYKPNLMYLESHRRNGDF